MADTVDGWLEAFQAARRPGAFEDGWTSTHGRGEAPLHLVIGAIVHGDEVGSLPAVVRLMRELNAGERDFSGTVTFFLGNPDAARAGVRFLESDLNRVFLAEPPDTLEGRRARSLTPVLDAADVLIDLHQTILPSAQPFWIFPFHTSGWHWARALGAASVWVTRDPRQAFSAGAVCTDEYVRVRGGAGLTLELGERGLRPEAEALAYRALARAMALGDAVAAGASLEAAAMAEPEIRFFETRHREPFTSDAQALRPGLINFQPVVAGEALSADGAETIVAPCDGMLLFPKYPRRVDGRYQRPLPGEIVRVIAPLVGHPAELYAG
jgi:succinylglutamate desuccinylase